MNESKPRLSPILLFGLIFAILVIPLGICGGMVYLWGWGFGKLKEPANVALSELERCAEVGEALGIPLTLGDDMTISDFENDSGNGGASVDMAIEGPKGKARVTGEMNLSDGKWNVENLIVELADGSKINYPVRGEAEVVPE